MLSSAEKRRLHQRYGPWAVITGASSGIGLELAERLAEAGLNVVLNARGEAALRTIADRLARDYAVQTLIVPADVSTETGVMALQQAVGDRSVGLFVGAAGFGTSGLLLESAEAEAVNMLRLNCEGLLRLTYHFSRIFAAQQRGGIVLMSSLVAFQGVPYSANYAATKAYVQSLAEALAVELRPHGVDVLAAAPGPVHSGFGARANMRMSMALTPRQVGAPILRALGRRTTVLPGWLSKLLVYSLRTVPRWAKVRIMQQVMRGMTIGVVPTGIEPISKV